LDLAQEKVEKEAKDEISDIERHRIRRASGLNSGCRGGSTAGAQYAAVLRRGGKMKSKTLTLIAAMTLFAATLAVPVRLVAQNQQEHHDKQVLYFVKDLGTLGGTGAVAEGISDRGWVAGTANVSGDQSGHAFLWRDGVMTDLGTLGGPNTSEQWPVKDNRGLIAGVAETTSADPLSENFCPFAVDNNPPTSPTGLTCLGFLWDDGVMTALPTLGGNNGNAASVNSRGQVVGWAETSTHDPTCLPPQVLDYEAVIWGPRAGEIHTLPPLPGDTVSFATGINERGHVVGLSGNCVSPNFNATGVVPHHGVIWEDGDVTDLGSLGGTQINFPWAINSQDQVVGQSNVAGDLVTHTFLWQKGVMTDLGVLPGDVASTAFGLNDRGEVVGGSCTLVGCRAFLW
jgi:probable HAF family extracellular repeat protein